MQRVNEFLAFALLIFGQSVLSSVHRAIGGLCRFLVLDHFLFQGCQDNLHSASFPVCQGRVLVKVHGAIGTDGGQVDLVLELDHWSLGRVLRTAFDRQHVDAVVEVGVSWPDDSTVPVSEGLVSSVGQSVGQSSVLHLALLSFLELVVKLE